MEHVMIDIETLGTGSNSIVKSIGAVSFDPFSGATENSTFYHSIALTKNDLKVGTITPSTLAFWMSQPHTVSDIFQQKWDDMPMPTALFLFNTWWTVMKGRYVWGYGANFDPVILEFWFDHYGIPVPWRYSNVRCARTVLRLADINLHDYHNDQKHNALFDADTQIRALHEAFKKLGISQKGE